MSLIFTIQLSCNSENNRAYKACTIDDRIHFMEIGSIHIDCSVETILQARDLAIERLLKENKQRFTAAGIDAI